MSVDELRDKALDISFDDAHGFARILGELGDDLISCLTGLKSVPDVGTSNVQCNQRVLLDIENGSSIRIDYGANMRRRG